MAVKFNNLSQVIPNQKAPVKVVLQGYASNWQFQLEDSNMDAITLAGTTITIEGTWYLATLAVTGEGEGNITDGSMEKIAGKTKVSLTSNFTPDADQTSNPGRGVLRIPGDLWEDEIAVNADSIPLLLCYLNRSVSSGQEVRISRFGIAFRSGKATDG